MTARARMLNRSADVARRRRLVSPFGPDSIDDATEVYGDWPEIDTPCDKSPVGQCEFLACDPDTCIHCGNKT